MDSRFALPVGAVIDGTYRIVRVVGSGGFGITYEAEDISLGTTVALKEYYPFDFGDRDRTMSVRPKSDRHKRTFEWGRSSFLQEARTLARFEHASIVRVTRVFEANTTAYMVMRLERGQSFAAWLEGLGRPPTQEELDRITGSLLGALEIMHAENFLHRDIAPDNIIVRADGTPVLLDFGAARRAVAEISRSLTGVVKAGYSPHEQYSVDSRLQGPWTDLYALGGTLYRAVVGRAPEEATLRVGTDHMPPATQAAKGTYRSSFLAAIDACLKVRHSERPQSVAQVRPMLLGQTVVAPTRVLDPAPQAPKAPSKGEPRRRAAPQRPSSGRWLAVAAALMALLGGAYGGYEFMHWQPADPAIQQAEAGRLAAEAEARRRAAADAAQRQAALEVERQRNEAADTARRQADIASERRREDAADAARRQADTDAERRRKAELARIAAEEEATRVAAAEAETRRKAEADLRSAAADREALTRSLQTALNRAGCNAGEVDGQWSTRGRTALALFAKTTKLDLATDQPSMAALEAVVARSGRVCPLECGDDMVETDGKCVPKTAKPPRKPSVAKSVPEPRPRPAEQATQAPRAADRPSASTGRRCAPDCWNSRFRNNPRCADC